MSGRHWFLPETPDVIGVLRRQLAATIEGADGFVAWAAGDAAGAQLVRDAQRRENAAKRELLEGLQVAFVLPLEPEDAFTLSRGIDRILDYTNNLVNESEVMAVGPDAGIAEMAVALGEALRRIDDAIGSLGSDPGAASAAADAAIAAEQRLGRAYYAGMGALLEVEDMRQRIARRELYRRCLRIGEVVVEVAERVVYAVVKQT